MTDQRNRLTDALAQALRLQQARRIFGPLIRPKLPDGHPAMTREDLARTRSTSRWQRVWGWLNRRGLR